MEQAASVSRRGEVELGGKTYDVNSRFSGAPSAAIGVYQLPGSNALDVSSKVRAALKEMSEVLGADYAVIHARVGFQPLSEESTSADFGLREVMHQVRHVAPTESPVLLSGETGVGKDVIANAIHHATGVRCIPASNRQGYAIAYRHVSGASWTKPADRATSRRVAVTLTPGRRKPRSAPSSTPPTSPVPAT